MHDWRVNDWDDFLHKAEALDTGPVGPRLSTYLYVDIPRHNGVSRLHCNVY